MSAVQMTPPKPVQCWKADDYAVKGRFVSELARPVLDLLAPVQGERVLDLAAATAYSRKRSPRAAPTWLAPI